MYACVTRLILFVLFYNDGQHPAYGQMPMCFLNDNSQFMILQVFLMYINDYL